MSIACRSICRRRRPGSQTDRAFVPVRRSSYDVDFSCYLYNRRRHLSIRFRTGVASFLGQVPGHHVEMTPLATDLGDVLVGQPVARTFSLRNMGRDRLLITNVKSTCRCTVAELPTRVLQTGGSVDLQVTFTAKSLGPQSQSVTVQTNDPNTPTRVLRLTARALPTTQPRPDSAIERLKQ